MSKRNTAKEAIKALDKQYSTVVTFKINFPYEIRKQERWDFNQGRKHIWYELWEQYPTFWRNKLKWRLMGYNINGEYEFGYKGDLAWAKRTAKRFNLKVPK